jgi:colanic acid/amylovoran biosynthesis glycosyltransferase
MRVAVFTRFFPTVSQTFVIRQVAALIERGHDVTIFARRPSRPEPLQEDVVRHGLLERLVDWRRAPSAKESLRALTPTGLALAARAAATPRLGLPLNASERPLAALRASELPRFDAILAHFGPQGLVADWLRELGVLRGPLATVFHGFDVSSYPDRKGLGIYTELFARSAYALPISEHWAERLQGLGCPADKIRVLRMGVRLEDHPFRPPRPRGGQPLRLIAVGRMVEKKGFQVAIDALARCREELDARGGFRLCLVGEGPERSEVEARVRAAGLEDCVELTGAKPASFVRNALENAHVCLVPSHTSRTGDKEGIPVVLMEAMALGVPVLSTRHSGIPELVPSRQLVPEKDVDALASALIQLADAEARWPEIAAEQRAIVERSFSAEVVDEELERILSDVAAHPRA